MFGSVHLSSFTGHQTGYSTQSRLATPHPGMFLIAISWGRMGPPEIICLKLPTQCMARETWLLVSVSSQVLTSSKDRDFTTSVGNLFHSFSTVTVKKFFLWLNGVSCQIVPIMQGLKIYSHKDDPSWSTLHWPSSSGLQKEQLDKCKSVCSR